MDNQYDLLFNIPQTSDSDDIYYHRMIPMVNVEIYRQVIQENLNIINQSKLSPAYWAKFKYALLKFEKEWQIEIFKWVLNLNNVNYPYIGIDIDWCKLENNPKRYFQVNMALEGSWTGEEILSNIWEKIDDAIEGQDHSSRDYSSSEKDDAIEGQDYSGSEKDD